MTGQIEWSRDPDPFPGDPVDDTRCLFGWGPPDRKGCRHRFGHGCDRVYRHPGRCMVNVDDRQPCESAQRPADWDNHGRAEASR